MSFCPGGKWLTNFPLATSRSYKDKNGELKEETEWHNIVAWGKLAEICAQYLSKGRQAYVEGRIHSRNWEDREGKKRTPVDIVADNVVLLGGRGEGGTDTSGRATASPRGASAEESLGDSAPSEITDDDIPF